MVRFYVNQILKEAMIREERAMEESRKHAREQRRNQKASRDRWGDKRFAG